MVSLKTTLNQSLQGQLSSWLTVMVIILALVAGTFSFITSFREMNEVQDDLLRQIASLFDADHLPIAHHGDSGRLANSDEESRVIVQYLTHARVEKQSKDGDLPLAFPSTLPDGMQTIKVDDESYRVIVKTINREKRIAVAQETAIRDEIAEAAALRTLIPFLVLLPILLLTIAMLIRRLFKPIATLSDEMNKRNEQDLHAFNTRGLPSEISPVVIAMNRLLEKVSQSMQAQRRFIADAAHELRSPMTALTLQAESLASAEMSSVAQARVQNLKQGLARSRHLLNQLLALTRIQSTVPADAKAVSIQRIYRHVLEDLHALADAKQIDIGVLGDDDVTITTDETDFTILIKNLVDNAIRYTPHGGKVDLAIKVLSSQIHLIVIDSGPGIAIEDRQRVLDPFYRVLGNDEMGSGLGLSIVKEIVEKRGWCIHLAFANETLNTGLMVTIIIDQSS